MGVKMSNRFNKSDVEEAALGWRAGLRGRLRPGPGPEQPTAERATFGDVVLPKLMSGEVVTESEQRSAEAYRRHLRPNDRYRQG